MTKQYADFKTYESKLERVMGRLGIESYDYDWSRTECWITFTYKGEYYRFSHSVKNAQEHNVMISYGSDAFAQLVLALEDLARMVERGIYDLGTWVSGMKCLPAGEMKFKFVKTCFMSLGFNEMPTEEQVKARFRAMVKVFHPDVGGDTEYFRSIEENYRQCLQELKTGREGEN